MSHRLLVDCPQDAYMYWYMEARDLVLWQKLSEYVSPDPVGGGGIQNPTITDWLVEGRVRASNALGFLGRVIRGDFVTRGLSVR